VQPTYGAVVAEISFPITAREGRRAQCDKVSLTEHGKRGSFLPSEANFPKSVIKRHVTSRNEAEYTIGK